MSNIRLSVLIPIYGTPVRNELFRYGLDTLCAQTLPKEQWELLIIDDETPPEHDVTEVFRPFIGNINIRHIRMNHKAHPIWQEMNPTGLVPGEPERWYHTPALSLNIGVKKAQGPIVCVTQPEILHDRENFQIGLDLARSSAVSVFASIVLSGMNFNMQYFHRPDMSYEEAWQKACNSIYFDEVGEIKPTPIFQGNETYWYIQFVDRQAFYAINGVDEQFLRGVYGEDDKAKNCMWLAGWPPTWDPRLRGIHLTHCYERHQKQRRESKFWEEGAAANRHRYFEWGNLFAQALRGQIPKEPVYTSNMGQEWGSDQCVEWVKEYPCGG